MAHQGWPGARGSGASASPPRPASPSTATPRRDGLARNELRRNVRRFAGLCFLGSTRDHRPRRRNLERCGTAPALRCDAGTVLLVTTPDSSLLRSYARSLLGRSRDAPEHRIALDDQPLEQLPDRHGFALGRCIPATRAGRARDSGSRSKATSPACLHAWGARGSPARGLSQRANRNSSGGRLCSGHDGRRIQRVGDGRSACRR